MDVTGEPSLGCHLDFGTANPDTTKLLGCAERETASPGGRAWWGEVTSPWEDVWNLSGTFFKYRKDTG